MDLELVIARLSELVDTTPMSVEITLSDDINFRHRPYTTKEAVKLACCLLQEAEARHKKAGITHERNARTIDEMKSLLYKVAEGDGIEDVASYMVLQD